MKIFNNTAIDSEFKSNGYVKFGSIDTEAIDKLLSLENSLKIPDYVGCDFNVGMNSDIYHARKTMQENLAKILMPYFETILDDYDFFSASFVNKNPTERFLICAHQDFTYSEEPEIPSFMCWVPLVDTNIENGSIGFIPKSHLFYDYKRAFPFPLSYSPIVKNEIELMKYLDIQEMKAGEMVFFFNKTVHGSFANYTQNIRYAINISFIKKNSEPVLYIRNPQKEEHSIIKFKADKNFLIQYNNPALLEMQKNKKLDIENYEIIGEEPFGNYDTSLESVEKKISEYGIAIQQRNLPYIERFIKLKKKEQLKDDIYSVINKFNPFKKHA